MTAGQVPANDVVGDRNEPAVWTLGTLDARLLAEPADPFVCAGWRVARFPRLSILEATRIDVTSICRAARERTELRTVSTSETKTDIIAQ